MQALSRWKESFTVASYEADFSGRLSVYSLFRRFQEVAGNHATHLEVGYEHLQKAGLAWILSRIKLEFTAALPRWGEAVHLETWPKGIDRLFALREFRLTGGSGQTLLNATTAWLLVDMAKGRPRRIESLPVDLTFPAAEHALQEPLEKLKPPGVLVPAFEKNILPSDLDVNNHVNNAEYAKWVMDCFSVETLRNRPLQSLQLNYLEETLFGDRVEVTMSGSGAEECYVEGVCSRRGSTLFQALVSWDNPRSRQGD